MEFVIPYGMKVFNLKFNGKQSVTELSISVQQQESKGPRLILPISSKFIWTTDFKMEDHESLKTWSWRLYCIIRCSNNIAGLREHHMGLES